MGVGEPAGPVLEFAEISINDGQVGNDVVVVVPGFLRRLLKEMDCLGKGPDRFVVSSESVQDPSQKADAASLMQEMV